MKRLSSLWVLMALVLSAWSCDDKVVNPAPGRVLQKGWRPAEIAMTEQELKDGGVGEVVTMGPWVLAMAGYGHLYLGKEGDSVWRKVAVPDSEPVSRIQTTTEGVFLCGVVNTGRVYTLDPLTLKWVDLGFPRQDSMRVRGLIAWQGRYVAFLSKLYRDSIKPIIQFSLTVGDQNNLDQGWRFPNTVTTVLGFDSILLAATFDDGIYRYSVGDPAWRKLPPAYYQSTAFGAQEIRRPRSFASLNGKLWVGQLIDGLYSTGSLDSAIQPYLPPDSLKGAIPVDLFALLAWRGRLFIGGSNPEQPMVLDPATNALKPIKGNFCRDAYGEWLCDYLTTWELAATTDTLYAASGGRLFKIGYNDIPQ